MYIRVDDQQNHVSQEMTVVEAFSARVPTPPSSHSSPSSPRRQWTQCLPLYLLRQQYLASYLFELLGLSRIPW